MIWSELDTYTLIGVYLKLFTTGVQWEAISIVMYIFLYYTSRARPHLRIHKEPIINLYVIYDSHT